MFSFIKDKLKQQLANFLNNDVKEKQIDELKVLIGNVLSKQQLEKRNRIFESNEFKVYSQFGDDGLIQFLVNNLEIQNNFFLEFGVEDYIESNTRFLLLNNNWKGVVFDASEDKIKKIKTQTWFWKHDLTAECNFITKSNINKLIRKHRIENVGLFHIDIDGNDYHILKEIDFTYLNPDIVIVEYNSLFGIDLPISIPYIETFNRTQFHYSNLYAGASLKAYFDLLTNRGYSFIGCNSAGNNGYFVKNTLLNSKVQPQSLSKGFRERTFRESRNQAGELSEKKIILKYCKVWK